MSRHFVGRDIWITYCPFHRVLTDFGIAYHGYLRYMLGYFQRVTEIQRWKYLIRQCTFGTEQPKAEMMVALPIMLGADTKACHIAQLAPLSLHFAEQIETLIMQFIQ